MNDDTGKPRERVTTTGPARASDVPAKERSGQGEMARRRFLMALGAVGVGTALSPEWVLGKDVMVIPNAEGFLLVDMKKCQGCGTCMMACSVAHTGEVSYTQSRIQIQQDSFADWPNDIHMAQCHQCPGAPCVTVCPVTPVKANKPNPKFGNVRMIDPALCIGCQMCIGACPFVPSRIQWNDRIGKSQKCDLCVDTPYLGAKGGPGGVQACVQSCPVDAIAFTPKMPEVNTDEAFTTNLRGPVWKKLGMTAD